MMLECISKLFRGPVRTAESRSRSFQAAEPAPRPAAEPETFQFSDSVQIHGHHADDPRHAQFPTSQYPLRTYMLTQDQQVASISFPELLEGMRARTYPSQRYTIEAADARQQVEQAKQQRSERLQDLDALVTGPRATPKDNSLNPSTVTMFTKSLGEVSGVYARQLAQIGQIEGFEVVLASTSEAVGKELEKQNVENISPMVIPQGQIWVEDYGEPMLGQGWVTPAIFQGVDVRETIQEGRKERLDGVDIGFSQHGQVHQSKLQPVAMAIAAAMGGEARQALSYLEGGNILLGSRSDGRPYALIGRDSLAVTRAVLTRQTGKEISDQKVLEVVAADLGLPATAVFGVEQPGEFHLDMRMMPVAPGEIALNDAKAAAEQQILWLRQELEASPQADAGSAQARFEERAQALRSEAERRAVYEQLTQRDLEAAGMKVHRLPGVFTNPDAAKKDTSNFFNARHGVNEQGERFSVFMGGKPEEEAFVAEKLLKEYDTRITRLHFLDPTQTPLTLKLSGGLKCRTKPDGVLVPAAELDRPVEGRLTA